MKQGWRWYGDADAITLKEIRQAGVTDIVAALYERKPGEVWPVAEIKARAKKVKDAGMTWSVVESVPIHEDIKKHTGNYLKYVANYKQTLRNLAKCGIKTVCYNFMPVLDWTRSNLEYALPDGSTCLEYNEYELAGFDMFYLKRPGAEKEYDKKTRDRATRLWKKLSTKEKKRVADSVLCGRPGTVDDLSPEEFLAQLKTYEGIDDKKLRENMYWFLNEISPVLEETGVDMCIHPDDPPHPIFGLPRILSNAKDIAEMYKKCPSKHVGLTLCTGSLGGDPKNDAVEIMKKFGKRVFFCHFRNLEYTDDKIFHESQCHLCGQTNIPKLFEEFLKEEKRRGEKIVVRPDHGRLMEIDDELAKLKGKKCYCGYSYGGRLIGLAELRGLEIGLKYAKKGL